MLMAAGFFKAFSSMLDSSVWVGTDKNTKLLWVTMLLMADKRGVVEAGIPGLAARSGLTMDEVDAALKVLQSPDKFSKSKIEEGRRVIPVEGGFKIVTYEFYRAKLVDEEKRIAQLARQKRYEEKKKKAAERLALPPPPNPETESPEY